MTYTFTIPGRLPGLNEYIEAERSHRLRAARMKSDAENEVMRYIRLDLGRIRVTAPVRIDYRFYEPDRRRDKDNIAGFAHKVIQDALVKAAALKNDGWCDIIGFADSFYVDKQHPRIEITITEESESDG